MHEDDKDIHAFLISSIFWNRIILILLRHYNYIVIIDVTLSTETFRKMERNEQFSKNTYNY